MKTLTKIITIIVILVVNNACYSNSSKEILWNEKCPSAVSDNAQERQNLKKEFPDFDSHFQLLLEFQSGEKISEPNENIQKEMTLTEKIIKEVFKPGIIPLESIKEKFMLSKVNITSNIVENVFLFRVKEEKYIIQFMKRLHTVYVTIRPTSGQTIEIPQLAEDIFNKRILPLKWEANFYLKELKRESKILKAGQWSPRDYVRMTPSGEVYRVQFTGKVEWLPLGEGLYYIVNFYTNGKFAVFAISGGPRPLKKDKDGYPGSAGVGSAENEDGNVGK